MGAARFIRELPGILLPLLVTVAAAALLLRALNAAPEMVARLLAGPPPAPPVLSEKLEFRSIEEAERELGVRIALPAYFPATLVWPPASVRGQREPVRVVSLMFLTADGRQALQLRELFAATEEIPLPVPEPAYTLEVRQVEVNGAAARLLLGRAQDGSELNQLRWRAGDLHLVATTILPPGELIRIAQSIHPS